MSGYILCQVPRAGIPYYIESISTNIYSIEELCYYLHHNPCLLDSTIMNEALCRWLKEELGLRSLAQKLEQNLSRNKESIRDFVYPVFKEINYLSYEDMKSFNGQIEELEARGPAVRRKLKGDCLVENRMYVNALQVYRELAEEYAQKEEQEEGQKKMLGSIYHNMGCAYSHLFQKEEALDCFRKAYECLHTGSALRSYLYAFYNGRTPLEYASKLAELGVDDQTRREIQKEIDKVTNVDRPIIPDHQIDGLLEQMTREYHRSTGS